MYVYSQIHTNQTLNLHNTNQLMYFFINSDLFERT